MSTEIRQRSRETQVSNGRDTKAKSMISDRPIRVFTMKKCLFVLVILIGSSLMFKLIFGRYPLKPHYHATGFEDHISAAFGFQTKEYAIMFDAGSTGTRILVFTFHRVYVDGNLKLLTEYFEEIKPGLSAYADAPNKAGQSLLPLLKKAKKLIPWSAWKKTPIVLKATAGLRLLPGSKSEAILDEVRKLFSHYPFLVAPDSVSIMDGKDEGLYSWFTVNFLLDTLSGDDEDMMASLDLGGGSTQVTLVANRPTLSAASKDIHNVMVFGRPLNLYIHSYLGLGLMAARHEILNIGNRTHDPESFKFISPCIHSIVNKKWIYANNEYQVKGEVIHEIPVKNSVKSKNSRVLRFEQCLKIANKVVNFKLYAPPELRQQKIYAMSYYFDRATENGLIDPFLGGDVKLASYIKAAKSACQHPNVDQPFACLDLTFISSLLNQGLGLNIDKKIILRKKIDGHELSWALGAAFHVLANNDKEKPGED
uniref:nucleoside diphosphate phosphatase n=1 Tax=Strigamia maritima TaxID=126957 RepID=T1J158_STRMM